MLSSWKPRSSNNDRTHTGIFRAARGTDADRPSSCRNDHRPRDHAIGRTMEPTPFMMHDNHRGGMGDTGMYSQSARETLNRPTVMFQPATDLDLAPPGREMYYTPRAQFESAKWQHPATEPNLGHAGGHWQRPATEPDLEHAGGYATPGYPGPMCHYSPSQYDDPPPQNDAYVSAMVSPRVYVDRPPANDGYLMSDLRYTALDVMPARTSLDNTPASDKTRKHGARTMDLDSTDAGESPSATSDSDFQNTSSDSDFHNAPVTSDSEPAKSDSEAPKSDSDLCVTSPEIATVLPQDALSVTSSSDELNGTPQLPLPRPFRERGEDDADGRHLLTAVGWDGELPQRQSAARGKSADIVKAPLATPTARARMNEKAPRRHMAKAKGLTRALDTELRDLEDEMSTLMRDLLSLRELVPQCASTYPEEVGRVQSLDPVHEDDS